MPAPHSPEKTRVAEEPQKLALAAEATAFPGHGEESAEAPSPH